MKTNPLLVSLPVAACVFLISIIGEAHIWNDDFENNNVGGPAEGWIPTGDGHWTIVLDESKTYDQSPTARDTWSTADSCPDLPNYKFKLKVKFTGMTDTASVQVLARVSSYDYHFGYAATPDFSGLFIYDDFEGILLDSISCPLELDTWYYYLTYLNGDVIKFKVWEVGQPEPQEYMLEAIGTNWMPGGVGLGMTGAAARFDDVEIFETSAEITCECLTPVFCRGKNFYFRLTVANNTEDSISGTLIFTGYSGYDCEPLNVLVAIPRTKTYPPGITETGYFFKVPVAAAPGQYSVSVGGELQGDALFCCMNTDIVECGPWRSGGNSEWELVEIDAAEIERALPTATSLSQNYPNPFNASTVINYQLAAEGHVKLEIFNLLGEKVATLVNGVEEAGYKSVSWDGSAVSSGIYFCKLTAGDYTETKRMMLVK